MYFHTRISFDVKKLFSVLFVFHLFQVCEIIKSSPTNMFCTGADTAEDYKDKLCSDEIVDGRSHEGGKGESSQVILTLYRPT